MPDPLIEIPNRAAFKAAEVCEIAHIPPYVLRSWEKEFPNLGVVARPGGPRVYRRGDIEQILRIKQLVFSEGLTLAGARRKLEGDPPPEPEPAFDLLVPEEVKARVGKAKHELRSLLDLLASPKASAQDARGPSAVHGAGDTPAGREEDAVAAAPPAGPVPAALPVAPPAPPATWPPRARGAVPPAAPDAAEPALPLLDAEADAPPSDKAAAAPARFARKRKRPQ
ncbi:MAG TPA: MerR family transcriptional regulator [Vicinamibacterales bacterium]|nr:MerR family transcriptional regulator [Vicinamibacterales bacterium]